MKVEILEDEEVEQLPRIIGRCGIRLGGGCGRAIMSDDIEAIPLGKDGMICGDCLASLFTARSWSGPPSSEGQREAGRMASDRAKANGTGILLLGSSPEPLKPGPRGPTGARMRKRL